MMAAAIDRNDNNCGIGASDFLCCGNVESIL